MFKNRWVIALATFALVSGMWWSLAPAPAWALTTIVRSDLNPAAELDLFGSSSAIMETLYGVLGTDFVRVQDSPLSGDQIWVNPDGKSKAQARYAGDTNKFGYFPGVSGGSFNELFTVTGGQGPLPLSSSVIDIPHVGGTGDLFRFALQDATVPNTWTSLMSDNTLGTDQMVTFEILNLDNCVSAVDSSVRCFVVAFEDRPYNSSDKDFNDLVVEVSGVYPAPEPATVLLLGGGMAVFGFLRRRRRE